MEEFTIYFIKWRKEGDLSPKDEEEEETECVYFDSKSCGA